MKTNFSRCAGLAVLALSLATGLPALAQQAGNPPPQIGGGNEWNNDGMDHQAVREEMQQIRKEHEDLEEARDKLLDKCVGASGAQVAECQKEKQVLHERHEKLHERTHAFHEKMDALHKEHHEQRAERRMEKQQQKGMTPPPAPPAQ